MKQVVLFAIALSLWIPSSVLGQQSVADARTYLMSMKVNPQTGQIPLNDVLQARQTADKMAENPYAKSAEINWEFMGPNNIGGRTRAILIDKDDPEKLIAGSVSGGLFTSNDGGLNWHDHPQNVEFATLSISAIAQAFNGDIYVGTGENFDGRLYGEGKLGNSVLPGNGIYKSTDNGSNFQLLENTVPSLTGNGNNFYSQDWISIKDLSVSPIDENRIYAATNLGLQISQDGGMTWAKANGVPPTSVVYNIEIASNGKVHILANNTYLQAEDGLNFTDEFTGSESGQFNPIFGNKRIAMSPSENEILYIVTLLDGCIDKIWQSRDSGTSWNTIFERLDSSFSPLRCRGWYSLSLAVDPSKPGRIFLGGAEFWSWSLKDGWNRLGEGSFPNYVHEDVQTIIFQPDNPKVMYLGSSGGITKSTNAHQILPYFAEMNKDYRTSQFYTIAGGFDGRVMGGTQGNGTVWITPDYGVEGQFITSGTGGFCHMSKLKPTVVFASAQRGRILRSPDEYTPLSDFFDNNIDCVPITSLGECNPDSFMDGLPPFVTLFVVWEDIIENLISGEINSKLITGNCLGEVWMTEGALDFDLVPPSWRKIGQFPIGCISAIAVSNNGEHVFIGTENGRFMHITDLDKEAPTTFETVLNGGQYITSIGVFQNSNHIIVGLGNYGQEQNIVESFNATSTNPTFSSLQHNLPLMPVYSVAIDLFNSNNILVGTELGIWQYDGTAQTWSENNGIMGRVPVHSLRFEQMGSVGCEVLYAGTHGRGMYRTTDFTLAGCNTDIVGIESLEEQVSALRLFPNPMKTYTNLDFTLTESIEISLQIFDLQGRIVQKQDLGKLTAQSHQIRIEKGKLNAGIYYLLLQSGDKQIGQKLLIH